MDISGSKVLLTIWTIWMATRETVRAVPKIDDVSGAKSVSDGEEGALKVERVAEGEPHVGDGGAGELANLGDAGVLPSVFDPWDVAADEDAEKNGAWRRWPPAKTSAVVRAPAPSMTATIMQAKANEGEDVFEEGAEGITADRAVGGLEKLL